MYLHHSGPRRLRRGCLARTSSARRKAVIAFRSRRRRRKEIQARSVCDDIVITTTKRDICRNVGNMGGDLCDVHAADGAVNRLRDSPSHAQLCAGNQRAGYRLRLSIRGFLADDRYLPFAVMESRRAVEARATIRNWKARSRLREQKNFWCAARRETTGHGSVRLPEMHPNEPKSTEAAAALP